MATEHVEALIEESIKLELNMARLYGIFAQAVEIDREFWWKLQQEEKSHASLIRTARDSFIKRGKFPSDLLADSVDDLRKSNAQIEHLIETCKAHQFTRCEACRTAVKLEQEAGELHYTKFMEKEAASAIDSVFKTLNQNDQDHANRIREHCSFVEGQEK